MRQRIVANDLVSEQGRVQTQWGCTICEAGSYGGFEGRRHNVHASAERQHTRETGHRTHVDLLHRRIYEPYKSQRNR